MLLVIYGTQIWQTYENNFQSFVSKLSAKIVYLFFNVNMIQKLIYLIQNAFLLYFLTHLKFTDNFFQRILWCVYEIRFLLLIYANSSFFLQSFFRFLFYKERILKEKLSSCFFCTKTLNDDIWISDFKLPY